MASPPPLRGSAPPAAEKDNNTTLPGPAANDRCKFPSADARRWPDPRWRRYHIIAAASGERRDGRVAANAGGGLHAPRRDPHRGVGLSRCPRRRQFLPEPPPPPFSAIR